MQRFWSKVKITSLHGCWEWTASQRGRGYGCFRLNRKTLQAHRVSYSLIRGEIPEGLELDHLCRNTSCVNPFHLEAVTHGENVRRGNVVGKRTNCLKGHSRASEHLYSNGNCIA